MATWAGGSSGVLSARAHERVGERRVGAERKVGTDRESVGGVYREVGTDQELNDGCGGRRCGGT